MYSQTLLLRGWSSCALFAAPLMRILIEARQINNSELPTTASYHNTTASSQTCQPPHFCLFILGFPTNTTTKNLFQFLFCWPFVPHPPHSSMISWLFALIYLRRLLRASGLIMGTHVGFSPSSQSQKGGARRRKRRKEEMTNWENYFTICRALWREGGVFLSARRLPPRIEK